MIDEVVVWLLWSVRWIMLSFLWDCGVNSLGSGANSGATSTSLPPQIGMQHHIFLRNYRNSISSQDLYHLLRSDANIQNGEWRARSKRCPQSGWWKPQYTFHPRSKAPWLCNSRACLPTKSLKYVRPPQWIRNKRITIVLSNREWNKKDYSWTGNSSTW